MASTVIITLPRLGCIFTADDEKADTGAVLTAFAAGTIGEVQAAGVPLRWRLTRVGALAVHDTPLSAILRLLLTGERPLSLGFRAPALRLLPGFGLERVQALQSQADQARHGRVQHVQEVAGRVSLPYTPHTPARSPLLLHSPGGAPPRTPLPALAPLSSLKSPPPAAAAAAAAATAAATARRACSAAATLDQRRFSAARARAVQPQDAAAAAAALPPAPSEEAARLRRELAALRQQNRAAKDRLWRLLRVFCDPSMTEEQRAAFERAQLSEAFIETTLRLERKRSERVRNGALRQWLQRLQQQRSSGAGEEWEK